MYLYLYLRLWYLYLYSYLKTEHLYLYLVFDYLIQVSRMLHKSCSRNISSYY